MGSTLEPSLKTSLTLNCHVFEDPFCRYSHILKDRDLDLTPMNLAGTTGPQSARNS